jgi:membrane protein DedA with SNARE-associated domain
MDCLVTNDTLVHLLLNYGSIVLFSLLVLGIIALPIPEETLLIFAGGLMAKGMLHIPSTILAAGAGSLCGITISYLLGLTGGHFLVQKYGKWVGITIERLEQAKKWFNRFGKWSLFIGYFIPGVRHFTGFTAGTAKVEYPVFSLFAYSGGIVWIATFLSIGYFFGDVCLTFLEEIDFKVVMAIGLVALGVVAYVLWQKKSQKKS